MKDIINRVTFRLTEKEKSGQEAQAEEVIQNMLVLTQHRVDRKNWKKQILNGVAIFEVKT